MIKLRDVYGLGRTDLDWLQATHHFCFAGYQDRERLDWGRLRVLNRTRLAPNAKTRPSNYANVELVFIVGQGAIELQRSDGSSVRVNAGQAVAIRAAMGIEFAISNPLGRAVTFTTIWLTSDAATARASVSPVVGIDGHDVAIASGFGEERALLRLAVPVRVKALALAPGATRPLPIDAARAYLLVRQGRVEVDGHAAGKEAGFAIENEPLLSVKAELPSKLFLFELG
jgi:redox-sensitive bicupin YhaK (pirin superfamily)